MRYVAAVVSLASCAMLTPAPVEERTVEQPRPAVNPAVNAEVNPEQPESKTDARKPKLKPSPPPLPPPPPPPSSEVSSCAKLNAGDLKETIKAKLDCITENAK
ncbi:hypothetical protein SAMN05216420_10418 [Nitrosospira sp. Nl5]|uniref:hypothetical protein n=1 Tax=Nitrosospira sp. Nl5 TaxID=200120 RepID=UPI00088AC8E9|nr:hypothetical protein [Nitrosospira sp. Nl5]SCY25831.1 hypothetical protein SAMN05216420_10418 [Nitrosospira sp. Nl5]